MKKKLLSLVLAGAMVATTSVSAFADQVQASQQPQAPSTGEISQTPFTATGKEEVNVTDTAGSAEINIEGKIANNQNQLPPSTISVTVPTIAKFTVDNKGKLIGSNINITSQSDTEVKVIAQKFTDVSGADDINAVNLEDLKTENGKSTGMDRKKVYLKLTGKGGAVSLQSNNGSGICGLTTSDVVEEEEKRVLGTVSSGKDLQLSLEGSAVTTGQALPAPVSDSFTLVLKLKKA